MKSSLAQISFFLTAALILAGCANSLQEVGTAGIDGIISDKTTGEPVAVVNVVIEETGASTITGTDGTFSFKDLREGSLTLLIKKDGYKDGRFTVQTNKDRTTEAHLVIERMPAVMTLDKEVLDFGSNWSSNTLSFSMINKSYAPLDWEIVHNCSWIQKIDPSKSIAPLGFGKTQTVVVVIDREKLITGKNETVIVVRSSEGSAELSIRATGQQKQVPALNTLTTTDVKASSAILNGKLTFPGYPTFTERGFVIAQTQLPTQQTALQILQCPVTEEQTFSISATSLTLGKTYYVRAYAVNEVGIAYSTNQDVFTTTPVLAKISGIAAYNEDRETNSAILKATIDEEGDPAYTERGFAWSTEYQIPTIDDNKVVVSGSGIGIFEKRITFPISDKPIWVRAYATNAKGTAYSDEIKIFQSDYIVLTQLNLGVHKTDYGNSSCDWTVSNNFCTSSRIGGHSDWRLPTIEELSQLYQIRKEIGNFKESSAYYWSSSQYGVIYNDYYNVLNFKNGNISKSYYSDTYNDGSSYYCRCVRTLN